MCLHMKFPDGSSAIICGTREQQKYCACGRAADLLCDWKVSGNKSGTCDKPICKQHALAVALGQEAGVAQPLHAGCHRRTLTS